MSDEKERLRSAPLDGVWVKSSYSNGSSPDCVQLMAIDGGVAVGDSKAPGRTPQRYTRAQFAAFLADVKTGAFPETPEH
ncbi:DUF397 domain-containing protein [Streptomyces sedi]|uniref:DUF397 domain-containing protein n=1 Tax=Streptomyces sedi TaxID=555059 RepID=A0A5C4VBT1_9ACTN|nr:DUF397 domain-containing protein [Streptomyces sedi]TNM33348.1 DUF397 domain-containing protein [Streptomyces sedi]